MQVVSEPTVDLGIEREPDHAATRVVALTPRQIFWREFRKDRLALVSIVFIVIMIALALAAPLIAKNIVHHEPNHLYLDRLDMAEGLTIHSRLGCQAVVHGDVVVEVPK